MEIELKQVSVQKNEEFYIPLAPPSSQSRANACREIERKCEACIKIIGGGLCVGVCTWQIINAVNFNHPNYVMASVFTVLDIVSLKVIHMGITILRNRPPSTILS